MLNEIWCGLFVALQMGLDTGVKFQREDWSGGYDLFRRQAEEVTRRHRRFMKIYGGAVRQRIPEACPAGCSPAALNSP